MFGLITLLDTEARQCLFATLADAVAARATQIQTSHIAAGMLRATSLQPPLERARVNIPCLLAALSAPPVGQSAHDELARALASNGEGTPVATSTLMQALPPGGGFVNLPVSPAVKLALQSLIPAPAHAVEESISPRALLLSLIETDTSIRTVCEHHGLVASTLRNT